MQQDGSDLSELHCFMTQKTVLFKLNWIVPNLLTDWAHGIGYTTSYAVTFPIKRVISKPVLWSVQNREDICDNLVNNLNDLHVVSSSNSNIGEPKYRYCKYNLMGSDDGV
jgi:hypothetical protein